MLTTLRTKIRSLIEDLEKSDFEVFEYTISKIFTLAEENLNTIVKVLKNGVELGSGEFSYDSATNKMEIIVSLVQGDKIEVDYTYNKYSDTEIDAYIRSALVWISLYGDKDFELEDGYIYPTPINKEIDLIAIISSVLIKPNYSFKSLPNLTVRYPRELSKEKKIRSLIVDFYRGKGIFDILEL